MMKRLFAFALVLVMSCTPVLAQQDPGKKVVGQVLVEVYHATDSDPKLAGKHAQPIDQDLQRRLQSEKQTRFKHYHLLGSDTKELFRSYENWAEPVKPSDEIMVRFEAQSEPSPKQALLDLELWLGRKKIVKTDIQLMADKPLWVRGPTWRQGHLIIAVSLQPSKKVVLGGLEFESDLVEVHAEPEDDQAQIDFAFTNTSDEAVFISHINPDCDCLTIEASGGTTLPDKRIRYRPGESGVIRSIFRIGNNKGRVDQKVNIWLSGDPKDQPSIRLVARIHVPQFVSMEPRALKWPVGAKPKVQRIDVVMQHDEPIHIEKLVSSSPQFEAKLETVEEGKRYAIWVHPTSTETPGMAVIQIVTDCKIENQSRHQVFAMVQRQ